MSNTYCGRSCAECEHSERIQCPGCKRGPGSEESDICELASCSRIKGYSSCDSCNSKDNCSKIGTHSSTPQYIRSKLLSDIDIREREGVLAGFVGKWQIMFFMAILSAVSGLISGICMFFAPTFGVIFAVVNALSLFVYAYAVYSMRSAHDNYSVAAITSAGAAILNFFVTVLFVERFELALLISIVAIVLNIVTSVKEFRAHSELLVDISHDLSSSWRTLWIWFIIANVGSLVAASIVSTVLTLAVGVLRFVMLYKTTVLLEMLQDK